MFKIYGGHEKFTQWTKGQKLIMSKVPVGAEIIFYNDPTVDDPLITEVYEIQDEAGNTVRVCDVPNILLTEAKRIKVRIPEKIVALYGIVHKYVGQNEKYFEVEAAEKPADYVYEETETEGPSSGNSSESGGSVSEDNIATDEEVNDVLDDIFGA